jgi:hypothetical protein
LVRALKLFVDDLRDPPDESWDVARNFHTAIYLLDNHYYDTVSLDHDIASFYGSQEMTGRHVLGWLVERKVCNLGTVPRVVMVHSANPVGRETMDADIARHWPDNQI